MLSQVFIRPTNFPDILRVLQSAQGDRPRVTCTVQFTDFIAWAMKYFGLLQIINRPQKAHDLPKTNYS